MNNKLDCDIVRDLLPSYLDGQTSNTSNKAVEEHISGCRECADILNRMKEPEKTDFQEKEEIDYLKKVKRKRYLTALLAATVTFAGVLILVCIRIFGFGNAADLNAQDVNIQVEGNEVYVSGNITNSNEGVARMTFSENDGVVNVQLFTAPHSPVTRGSFNKTYTAKSDPVKAVTSSGVVLWEDGNTISRTAGKLYAARNPYVGNMPANEKVANAVGIREHFGMYKNELQTSKEPYGWTIILENPIDPSLEEKSRQRMCSDSCLMLAAVDNLGTVTWRYDNGSGQKDYTITKDEASKVVGADIKSFAESASNMQKLVEMER